jgi:hypothetical protein
MPASRSPAGLAGLPQPEQGYESTPPEPLLPCPHDTCCLAIFIYFPFVHNGDMI